MFSVHKVWSNKLSVRNLVLLFLTIVIGFASVFTLAQVNITSDINNAWQTIGRVSITSGWTENGTRFFDFNYSGNGETYINPNLFTALPNFAWRVLWIDDSGNLISVYSRNLIVSWSNIVVAWSGDDDWTMIGNDMYATHNGNIGIGTTNPAYKLHIVNSWSTDVFIEEKAAGMAANLNLKNPTRTWTMWADSYPDVFYIGIPGLPQFFSINPLWYVGIDTNSPQEKLEVSGGNIRINNLKNKVILGTDSNGTIIAATSGNVYNFISWFALSWPQGNTWATGAQWIQWNTWAQWATGPAWVGSWVGDNLWNHTATTNLLMGQYRIAYNGFIQWLHILPDWRTQVFSTIQVANQSWLVCNSTNSGTIKYIPNCFQWCDWTNRITLWWTCIWLPAICGDGTMTAPEQCDDGNQFNNDWCSSSCQREVPTCNFTFTPTSWTTPLQVTFRWVEQDRVTYGLNFGNWYSINNQRPFSWTTYTYQSIGEFIPQLTVKNKYNESTQTSCYAAWWTTWISINSSCWDGILTAPEQCDDDNQSNNDWCSSSCQREVPTCNFTFTPTSWTTPLQVTFRWSSTDRALYTLNFGNWYGLYDLSSFSWQQYTYQSIGNFVPTLLVKNKYNVSIQTWCYAWWTTTGITVSHYCWNWIVESWEQCDGGDWCNLSCQRATPPACNFTFTPTSWTIPLHVTFVWSSTGRVVYTLNFDNGYEINNQPYFSWVTTTYSSVWTYHPTLVAKNKYDLDLTTGCSAVGTATINTIREPKYCGDWIVQNPNDSGNYEECDLWTANSSTWKCGTDCTYNIPDCTIFTSPSIFTWGSWTGKLTWQISPRAIYVIRTTLPDGSTQQYSELKLQTGFEITNQYNTTGEYTITLASNDWVWASCSTTVNVYDNWEYACGKMHKTDQTNLNELNQWLCAQWYKAINFINNSWTIDDVWPGKGKKHAIIIPQSSIDDYLSQFTYIDTGKNMVQFSGWYYIRFLRNFMNININILLPQQWYKYRTRDCVNSNDDKTIVSSCYAHKTINGDCAYDMNIGGGLSSRYFTTGQISEAMANSWYLFKCILVENENSITDVPQYKFTRWLPTQGGRGNPACQVIPVWPQTEQNLYYVHRVCPWYNYWQSSQSCDSILLSGQGIVSCSWLLAELYTSWWTWGFSTQK